MSGLNSLGPLLAVTAGAFTLLLLGAFSKKRNPPLFGYIAIAFLGLSAAAAASAWGRNLSAFHGALLLDDFALLLAILTVAGGILIVLVSLAYVALHGLPAAEYFALLLFSLAGILIMVSSRDLLVIFLGLEVLSVSGYALAGMKRRDPLSNEAAVKYFLMGSLASAFFVFGLAFLFGCGGTLDLQGLAAVWSSGGGRAAGLFAAGFALSAAGLAFKIALVPFHMWAPDVYQGAPSPVTAFFSFGPKFAGLAVFLRLAAALSGGGALPGPFIKVLWTVSALTMIAGNLLALRPANIKRILAYSSIAHAGTMLVAVLAGDASGLLYYFAAYLLMIAGAFGVVIMLGRREDEALDLEDYAGLGRRHPWLAGSLALILVSLAGFPPTAGFLAKFYVFSAAVRAGFPGLVVIGVLASLIGVACYFRIIVAMYMKEPSGEPDFEPANPALLLAVFICLFGILRLGISPGNLLVVIREAAASVGIF